MAQYLKPDCELGYIEENADVECAKFNNLRHSILGCMLGDYDETGAYVVEPQIVKELIEMPKYIVDVMDNIEICKSVLKLDKQISFIVTFEGNKATLSLIEKLNYEANFAINSGSYSNINEYVLDSVETSGEINRNTVYTRWNIGSFGGNIVDIFSCEDEILEKYFGIVNRFKYLLQANKMLLEKEEEIEEVEAEYANYIFEIIKHYPKLQQTVMNQVKQTLTEKKEMLSVKKPNFAKTLNEILENAITSNKKELTEKEKQEFEIEKHNATNILNVKRSDIIAVKHNSLLGDMAPSIVSMETNENIESRSVKDWGEEFVSANQKVVNALNTELYKKSKSKNALISFLVQAGLANAIGYVEEVVEVKEAVTLKQNKNENVEEKAKPKKAETDKSVTPQKKKTEKQEKKTEKQENKTVKQEKRPQKQEKKIEKQEQNNNEAQIPQANRIIPVIIGEQQEVKKKDKDTNVDKDYVDAVANAKRALLTGKINQDLNNKIKTETSQNSSRKRLTTNRGSGRTNNTIIEEELVETELTIGK